MSPEDEVHFRGQQAGERVKLALRQHPFTLIEHVGKVILLVLVAVGLYRYLGGVTYVGWVTFILIIMAVLIGVRSWYGWWNTMMLLTNIRVLFVEQKGFTSRKMSEAMLSNIQFVTNEVKGLAHTMFNFGDIKIQTAGSVETLLLRDITDPYEVQQAIMKIR